MKLERLANQIVAVVRCEDPIDLAIQHMWKMNIRHLPVVRENVPVGMVSERNILFHVCWLGTENADSAIGSNRVEHIMTKPVLVLSPEDPVESAAQLMINKRIGCVPLVAHSQIVGIVTETDFLRCYNDDDCLIPSDPFRKTAVGERMSANVHTVKPEDAVLSAVRIMREKQVRHVAVMDNDDLVGIISDRDVLRGSPRSVGEQAMAASDLRIPHEYQVVGIMTQRPEVVSMSGTLAEAAHLMVKHKIGALPVLENGKLAGIISETDLLRALVVDCKMEA